MKNRDLIAWLQQRDPDEEISLAGSELAKLVYPDQGPDDMPDEDELEEALLRAARGELNDAAGDHSE